MDDSIVYTATVRFSSTLKGGTRIEYFTEPSYEDLVDAVGEDGHLPMSFALMEKVLRDVVLPVVSMNERYEAEFADELDEDVPRTGAEDITVN